MAQKQLKYFERKPQKEVIIEKHRFVNMCENSPVCVTDISVSLSLQPQSCQRCVLGSK